MSKKDNLQKADGKKTDQATDISEENANIEVVKKNTAQEELETSELLDELSSEGVEVKTISNDSTIETSKKTSSVEEAIDNHASDVESESEDVITENDVDAEITEPEIKEVDEITSTEEPKSEETPDQPSSEEVEVKTISEDSTIEESEKTSSVEETIDIDESEDVVKENDVDAEITEPEIKESDEITSTEESKSEETPDQPKAADDHAINEIESTNAKEAEHEHKSEPHQIVERDYHSMSMNELVDELGILLKSEKIQLVKSHVERVKQEFNSKFAALLEKKKHEFLEAGGNSIDFKFDFPLKTQFNAYFKEFRERRQAFYKNLETSLKGNLENRLEIIDEIKGLLNVEENINTTYKHFKTLQEGWRKAGPIPRDKYNNVWNNYHHHVENFYDFLHLNRDLRDLDFKHNLEEKQKIIVRAEELARDDDSNRAFRELQALHKMWKEELGPVAIEHRDEIWERFRAATKSIHDKRQAFFDELDKVYVINLEKKKEIITDIEKISEDESNNHSAWQKKIRTIEDLRQQFFKAGKVPIKVNEATWRQFKEAVRVFNRKKNLFYKDLKKDQYDNLQKKLDLIKLAEEHKESEDFEVTTPLMKKVQSDWKKIGHVPRKESDKIWNQFKTACNHYFNKLHEQKNAHDSVELEAYDKKNELLNKLKSVEFTDDQKNNLEIIKQEVDNWKNIGRVPNDKRYIEGKFNKMVNSLYNKLDISKGEVELLKFKAKIDSFVNSENKHLLDNEHNFIRKKIDEIKSAVNQLENNLLFFAHVKDDNPVVVDVNKKIDLEKEGLEVWQKKLRIVKKHY